MLGRSWSSFPTDAGAQERKHVYRMCTTVFPELEAFLSQAIPDTRPNSQPVHTGGAQAARSAIVALIFRAYPNASSGYPGTSRGVLEAPWCRLVGTEPEATAAWAVRPPKAPRAGAQDCHRRRGVDCSGQRPDAAHDRGRSLPPAAARLGATFNCWSSLTCASVSTRPRRPRRSALPG